MADVDLVPARVDDDHQSDDRRASLCAADRRRVRMAMAAIIAFVAALCVTVSAIRRDAVVITHARGSFDVKITPVTTDPILGRMSLTKVLHGDLEGTSAGEMLTAGTAVKDSGAYVAVEYVT